MPDQKIQVLICGAGPTGLALAYALTRSGISVRIVDKAATAGTTSRAIVMHARTLELYHQLGIDNLPIERGTRFDAFNLWVGEKLAARAEIGIMGKGISPYPFILNFPQDAHEAMLEELLAKLNVHVERNIILTSFLSGTDYVQAQLQKPNGEIEKCEATFLAGCDGAHSAVRLHLGFSFPGGTYQELFYVADLHIKGAIANGELNLALDQTDFLAVFPMKGDGHVRVIGTIVRDSWNKEQIRWEDVSESIIHRLNVVVEEVNWFSSYRVHHRVATHFKKDNIFLLGDAGHIHSPVGGQGMNTGIGDAMNLAWKLAAVINDRAPLKLLDTYEPERIKFARTLVNTTDNSFTFVNAQSWLATKIRTRVVPKVLPILFRSDFLRRLMFKIVSQTQLNYRTSPLSAGSAGKVKGGDRLPWIQFGSGADNFSVLTTRKWQVHRYGDQDDALQSLCTERGVALNVFEWRDEFHKTGIIKNAVYLVRPDGHVGLAQGHKDLAALKAYMDLWNLRRFK